MKTYIKNQLVEIEGDFILDDYNRESLELLMQNHTYNNNVDWDKARRQPWKKKRT